jgi:hypothetical protein
VLRNETVVTKTVFVFPSFSCFLSIMALPTLSLFPVYLSFCLLLSPLIFFTFISALFFLFPLFLCFLFISFAYFVIFSVTLYSFSPTLLGFMFPFVFAPLSFLSICLSFFVFHSSFLLTCLYFLCLYRPFFLSGCNCYPSPPPRKGRS